MPASSLELAEQYLVMESLLSRNILLSGKFKHQKVVRLTPLALALLVNNFVLKLHVLFTI